MDIGAGPSGAISSEKSGHRGYRGRRGRKIFTFFQAPREAVYTSPPGFHANTTHTRPRTITPAACRNTRSRSTRSRRKSSSNPRSRQHVCIGHDYRTITLYINKNKNDDVTYVIITLRT